MIKEKVKYIYKLGTPRNFYGPEKFYKAYNGTDADAF